MPLYLQTSPHMAASHINNNSCGHTEEKDSELILQVVTTKMLLCQKSSVNCLSRGLKGWHVFILPKMDFQQTCNGLYSCAFCTQKVSVTLWLNSFSKTVLAWGCRPSKSQRSQAKLNLWQGSAKINHLPFSLDTSSAFFIGREMVIRKHILQQ